MTKLENIDIADYVPRNLRKIIISGYRMQKRI